MRLFTGLWPPAEVINDLSAAVRALPAQSWERATANLTRFRLIPPEKWHLTLCFHGEAESETVRARLDRQVLDAAPHAARLRLARAGVFRGVLWVGVEPAGAADAEALRTLARVAGADPSSYRAHVTIARWRSGRADTRQLGALFADYAGPWWSVDEIALISSEQRGGESIYRSVHRVPLTSASSGERGGSGSDC